MQATDLTIGLIIGRKGEKNPKFYKFKDIDIAVDFGINEVRKFDWNSLECFFYLFFKDNVVPKEDLSVTCSINFVSFFPVKKNVNGKTNIELKATELHDIHVNRSYFSADRFDLIEAKVRETFFATKSF